MKTKIKVIKRIMRNGNPVYLAVHPDREEVIPFATRETAKTMTAWDWDDPDWLFWTPQQIEQQCKPL